MKLTRRQKRDVGETSYREDWSPFNQLTRLRDEINRLFQAPFGQSESRTGLFQGWGPPFDMYEDKDKFTVTAELPGMKKEDIEIAFSGNTLTISGERKKEEEHKGAQNYRSERYFGRFQRNIVLPQAVDSGKITAGYKDGLLTVTLPKTEEAKRKQIEVQIT
jgi:HSP20 family protein